MDKNLSKLGLLFSGQGAQKPGMGKSLAENFSLVATLYDRANEILGWDLKRVSFEGPNEELTETKVCQPALFVHGMAIVEVLKERGVFDNVQTVLGLSLGEVTACAAAGVFNFEIGLKVVAERGRLMQEACEATDGAMAAIIGVAQDEVAALCKDFDVEMANLNAPGQIIISGEKTKIAEAVEGAKERGYKRVIPLNVAGAYHSRLMEPARNAFAQFLETVEFHRPQITLYTNTTGKEISDPSEIREALVKQVVSSVRWEECQRNAAATGIELFIECGPGAVLSGLARRIDREIKTIDISETEDLAKLKDE